MGEGNPNRSDSKRGVGAGDMAQRVKVLAMQARGPKFGPPPSLQVKAGDGGMPLPPLGAPLGLTGQPL